MLSLIRAETDGCKLLVQCQSETARRCLLDRYPAAPHEDFTIAEAVKPIYTEMDIVLHACQFWQSCYMITDDEQYSIKLQAFLVYGTVSPLNTCIHEYL